MLAKHSRQHWHTHIKLIGGVGGGIQGDKCKIVLDNDSGDF